MQVWFGNWNIVMTASHCGRLFSSYRCVVSGWKMVSPTEKGFVRYMEQRCCQPLKFARNVQSDATHDEDVSVEYQHGQPVLSVPLPSRREICQFTLKPVSTTVGDFLKDVQLEDRGIDRASIYTPDGRRISSSTGIDVLLQSPFTLIINETSYSVKPPSLGNADDEQSQLIDDIRVKIGQLYSALNVGEHQLQREEMLQRRLAALKEELDPLEKKKIEMAEDSKKYTRALTWTGLGLMGIQFGVLARLTWWEYSWDIMEPVTYFVTYGTTIAMYSYFVATRQEYSFTDVADRQYLFSFHKRARKSKLDVDYYNKLKNSIAQVELDLQRLRDPLQLNLPIQQIRGPHSLQLPEAPQLEGKQATLVAAVAKGA